MSDFNIHGAENEEPLNAVGIEDLDLITWLYTNDFSHVISNNPVLPVPDSNTYIGYVPGYGM